MASSVLQCLVTLACLVLATRGAAPLSYRSIKTVLLNPGSAQKLPAQCTAICEDSNGDPLERVHIRDPSSCQQYWICMPGGSRYEQPHVCPQREIVNIDTLLCEPIINDGSGQCTIPDRECDPSIPKVCYNENTCPPTSDGIFPFVKKDDECDTYHVCHYPDVEITCAPDTPHFNGQECVNDPEQCCKCQAVCSDPWTFISDPSDCHSYYLCQDLDGLGKSYIATEEERFTCPIDHVIDVVAGHCVESATCDTICPGSDISTTTTLAPPPVESTVTAVLY